MDPEFQREIGNGAVGKIIFFGDLPFKFIADSVKLTQIGVVFGKLLKAVLGNTPQKGLGVPRKLTPQIGIYTDKKFHSLRVPAPPDVVGKIFQKLQFRRDPGSDVEKLEIHKKKYFPEIILALL